MEKVGALTLVPVGIFAFLGGAVLGVSRKGMSMSRPEPEGPIRGVPLVAWRRFVTVMAVAPRDYVSPRGRTGMFGMDARRLRDVGFMKDAKKASVGGEVGVWVGSWQEPVTREKFLASPALQYEAFRRSATRMAPRVSGLVGKVVDGQRCSLSGLLGVGHLAGEEGVRSWVEDPAVRRRFSTTTKNFARTNGIF